MGNLSGIGTFDDSVFNTAGIGCHFKLLPSYYIQEYAFKSNDKYQVIFYNQHDHCHKNIQSKVH